MSQPKWFEAVFDLPSTMSMMPMKMQENRWYFMSIPGPVSKAPSEIVLHSLRERDRAPTVVAEECVLVTKAWFDNVVAKLAHFENILGGLVQELKASHSPV